MTKPPSEKKKLPRLKRVGSAELPHFQLTPRDIELLNALYTYRALSTPQIDALFFDGGERSPTARSSSRCLHRLKLLFHAGYVRRVEQAQTLSEGRKPLVYFLDTRGAHYLAGVAECSVQALDWDRQGYAVGSLFLDHLLLSNDIQVAVTIAARHHGYTVTEWRDERTLRKVHKDEEIVIPGPDDKPQKVTLIPDGYFLLETDTARYHQFLEVDRGTATIQVGQAGKRDWARKVVTYLAYFRSGAYQKRYQTGSLRILTVTTSEKRLQLMKQVTEESGGQARFWFTTFDKISASTIITAPIWQVASREGLHRFVW